MQGAPLPRVFTDIGDYGGHKSPFSPPSCYGETATCPFTHPALVRLQIRAPRHVGE